MRIIRTSAAHAHGVCTPADPGDANSRVLGGAPGLGIMQGTGLSPGDRSFDRNEQHRAALEHYPANGAYPRRAVRLGTCLHLLIAGSHVEVPPELRRVRGWCRDVARSPGL